MIFIIEYIKKYRDIYTGSNPLVYLDDLSQLEKDMLTELVWDVMVHNEEMDQERKNLKSPNLLQ